MSNVILQGHLGPAEALSLRKQLALLAIGDRPRIHIDLSSAETVHISIVAALIKTWRDVCRRSGHFSITLPNCPDARRCFDLVDLID